MVYTQPKIRPKKWDAQISLRFWDKNESANLGKTTTPSDGQKTRKKKKEKKKTKTWRIVDFTVPAGHWVKESEKRDKYRDQAREMKKNYET